MNKPTFSKVGDGELKKFFGYFWETHDLQKAEELYIEKEEENKSFKEDILDSAIQFLYDYGKYEISDVDGEKATHQRDGKTFVDDNYYLEWGVCYSEYFSNRDCFFKFYPSGYCDWGCVKDDTESLTKEAEEFATNFMKSHPDISVFDAIKLVYMENNKH